jgi:hypothetical protein
VLTSLGLLTFFLFVYERVHERCVILRNKLKIIYKNQNIRVLRVISTFKDCVYKVKYSREARWPRGQCTRRVNAEVKQRSQSVVIGWVSKNLLFSTPSYFARYGQ